jgi:hypothetical protein
MALKITATNYVPIHASNINGLLDLTVETADVTLVFPRARWRCTRDRQWLEAASEPFRFVNLDHEGRFQQAALSAALRLRLSSYPTDIPKRSAEEPREMAKISDVYSGEFVSADQLPRGTRLNAIITATSVEQVGQDQNKTPKVVLSLRATDGRPWPRRLVLNKTNGLVLASSYGDETSNWVNRPVEIWSEPVVFQGRSVMGIRMAAPMAQAPAPNGATTAGIPLPQPAQLAPSLPEEIDDSIPH